MSVADLLDSGVAPPTVIKLDAEGGEGESLESAAHLLPENSRLVVSVHCAQNYRQVMSALQSAGFHCLQTTELEQLGRSDQMKWGRAPDLLTFGPAALDCFSGYRSLTVF